MKRFFQLRYLRYKTLLNHLKTLWFVLLPSQSRPRPSPTILNDKDSFLFLSFCLPLVADTAGCNSLNATSPVLHSTCFFPLRIVSPAQLPLCPTPRDAAFQRSAWLGDIRKSRAPRVGFRTSSRDVSWPGPVSRRRQGCGKKQNFTGLSSVGDTFPGCTRGCRAPFRGCEKRGGIPFEAGSSAVRKSGPQRGEDGEGGGGVALAECFPRHKKGLVKVFAIHFL